MDRYFDVEVAFDGHNHEIFADIYVVTQIDHNRLESKKVKQIVIQYTIDKSGQVIDPTIEQIVEKVVDWLNENYNAGIDEYNASGFRDVASYHYAPKTPIFEVEEYETDKFRVLNHADPDNEKKMKALRDAREIKPEYEIINYGITTHGLPPYKTREIWGPFFRMTWIAQNLVIRQELNILSYDQNSETDEGLTVQNLVKNIVVDLNTYNNAGIESYDMSKPIIPTYYIGEDGDSFECLNYGTFTLLNAKF